MKAFISILFSLLVLGCSQPAPKTVIDLCFKRISNKNYNKSLIYVTPRVATVYSNNLWITKLHSVYIRNHDYQIESIKTDSPSQTYANCTFTFFTAETDYSYKVRLDLIRLKDKWYIDDIWHLEDNGKIYMNALDNAENMRF